VGYKLGIVALTL